MRTPQRLLVPVALLTGVALFGAACDEDETAGPEAGGDVEDVAENDTAIDDNEFGIYEDDELGDFEDDGLVGRTVTVSAAVDRIVEPGKAIAIGADVVEGGLLVLMPPQLTDVPTIEESTEVQVTGQLVHFVVADLEDDYDPFDLSDDLYVDWEDENAVVAQAISLAPTEEAAEGDTEPRSDPRMKREPRQGEAPMIAHGRTSPGGPT